MWVSAIILLCSQTHICDCMIADCAGIPTLVILEWRDDKTSLITNNGRGAVSGDPEGKVCGGGGDVCMGVVVFVLCMCVRICTAMLVSSFIEHLYTCHLLLSFVECVFVQ